MFPATIFDYNGVLVDDEVVHLEAFRDVLAPLGIALSEEDYWRRYLGFDDAGAFRAILSDHARHATDEQIRQLIEAKRPRYLVRAKGALRGFAGAAELLRRRAAAGPVAIVSGALRDEISLGLSVLGAEATVDVIVSAEDTEHSKPHPEGYLRGIEALRPALGDHAAHAVVIEDSIAGVEAAKAAKLVCVAVTHSYAGQELSRAGADLVVDRLDDITDAALSTLAERSRGA
ncbi:MAG TPA: HAD family phosphatase [Polyangiaceae bacterium]|nr:HAD family phosphatase [Polyangiaceae bacterium]